MSLAINKIEIRYEHDIVLARQRARAIADMLGFDTNEQTRISTAVSEIARNAFVYAGGGEVEFLVEERDSPQLFVIRIKDRGPGIDDLPAILECRYQSKSGMGLGLIGARRLMDTFHIESTVGKGTMVLLGQKIPPKAPMVTPRIQVTITDRLSKQSPQNPFEEVQQQNQELLRTMNELKERQEESEALNLELADTNRGIVALYAELEEKASHLNRANELKAEFLANMSHEFKTPLNSITSLSRLLLDRVDGELNAEQEKQVTFIKMAAADLSILVNDLLDIAKIEAGKLEVRPAAFEVGNLFSTLRGMLKPILVSPAVQLLIDAPQVLPTLQTDEGKVSQILRNLISNAIKFTEKGEIRVSAELDVDGESIIFSVADTGIGIGEEHLERIFEEYVQVDSPMNKKAQGTGLGLSLSRKLAKLLGGRVTVESTLGQGSIFSAIIPIAYIHADADGNKLKKTVPLDSTRRSILVVEDDESTIAIYEKYLKGSGFQVLAAYDTKQAREMIKNRPPVAVILDILLRGEEAWQLLAELKSSEATRHIPIFVLTVLEDKERGLALGADDFATKPVDRGWLLKKLRQVAQRGPMEKVLVIDDEEVARYILKDLLADTKYAVLEAASGKEGIRCAEQEQPNIIFLDLMMSDMDGFETLMRLKASPKTEHIPVIILSAKVLDEQELKTLTGQTVAILNKESTSREVAISKIRDAVAKIALE